ncbi:uncharacterized protein ATNIH1004_001328 [Aspergillus tanneri]|uniref:Uncharacterized protein n=1 Tax=Aspergillus tanneri TaxID=1220188 RepID=A0A5M9N4B1_9EURO|nr:uncharacterized protein ATNIH1004_001328 [Aspergillus tanneri]KAA8652424.1 hypothetical protein ATNIH1004_001328 [Aspergillus tanneri]
MTSWTHAVFFAPYEKKDSRWCSKVLWMFRGFTGDPEDPGRRIQCPKYDAKDPSTTVYNPNARSFAIPQTGPLIYKAGPLLVDPE